MKNIHEDILYLIKHIHTIIKSVPSFSYTRWFSVLKVLDFILKNKDQIIQEIEKRLVKYYSIKKEKILSIINNDETIRDIQILRKYIINQNIKKMERKDYIYSQYLYSSLKEFRNDIRLINSQFKNNELVNHIGNLIIREYNRLFQSNKNLYKAFRLLNPQYRNDYLVDKSKIIQNMKIIKIIKI